MLYKQDLSMHSFWNGRIHFSKFQTYVKNVESNYVFWVSGYCFLAIPMRTPTSIRKTKSLIARIRY